MVIFYFMFPIRGRMMDILRNSGFAAFIAAQEEFLWHRKTNCI
jgi:hypothetical protein